MNQQKLYSISLREQGRRIKGLWYSEPPGRNAGRGYGHPLEVEHRTSGTWVQENLVIGPQWGGRNHVLWAGESEDVEPRKRILREARGERGHECLLPISPGLLRESSESRCAIVVESVGYSQTYLGVLESHSDDSSKYSLRQVICETRTLMIPTSRGHVWIK